MWQTSSSRRPGKTTSWSCSAARAPAPASQHPASHVAANLPEAGAYPSLCCSSMSHQSACQAQHCQGAPPMQTNCQGNMGAAPYGRHADPGSKAHAQPRSNCMPLEAYRLCSPLWSAYSSAVQHLIVKWVLLAEVSSAICVQRFNNAYLSTGACCGMARIAVLRLRQSRATWTACWRLHMALQ